MFFTGNIWVFINQYFSTVHALSNAWDLSTAWDYTLSDDNLTSVQRGYADLDLQLTQTWVLGRDDANNVFLDTPRWVAVSWNYAYVSAYTPDRVQVVDISDPTNPLAGINLQNNNTSLMLNGPMDMKISGDYLYIAEYIGDAIQVLDISNPALPISVGNYANNASVRLNGPRWLDIQWNYLYVASWVDDAIQIFDITDPTNLIPAWQLDTTNGRLNGARDIIVEWDYAYVSARNDDSIQILDISDPTNPVFTWELEHNNTSVFLDSVFGIHKQWNYLYATAYINDGIQIIDVSDPTTPTWVSYLSNTELPGLNGPRSLHADWDFLFIWDYIGDSVMVVDISNPTDPLRESELGNSVSTNLNGSTLRMVRIWDLLYFGSYTDDDFVILESWYTTSSPTVIPNTSFNYWTENLSTFTETTWTNHEWTISYQISKNNGTDWYYYNGSTWTLTTAWVTDSNSASVINTNISDFNSIGSGNEFLWKAFLTSDGDQRVELDEIQVDSVAGPILSLTKTDDDLDNTVQTDQIVEYTIILSNSWSAATGISITDDIDSDFGIPLNFSYTNCGNPSESFINPTLTFSSISVWAWASCTIKYELQVDSNAADGDTISNSADASSATEWWNDPAAVSADNLTILACGVNDVDIAFTTDNWWEDTYWSLTPSGNACGVWEIANGWNTIDLTCASGGAQSANPANGYADNTTITEWSFSLTVWAQYDIHVIDDWGDDMTAGPPDVQVQQNGWAILNDFDVVWTGWIFTFTVQEPDGCMDVMKPNVTIEQKTGQADPTSLDSAEYTILFDEAINIASFTSVDISLSGTTWSITSGPTEVAPNNGTTFEITVTWMTDWDTVVATILAWVVEDIAGNTNTSSTSIDNSITYTTIETDPPNIDSTNFSSGSLLPGWNHDISITYSDAGSGIDSSSASITLHKWDGISAWWSDISWAWLTVWSITATGATYSTNSLDFGKYQYRFSIDDNDGNTANQNLDFYIDIPELIISTPEIDLGILWIWTQTFSPTVNVTVHTVWAWFDVTFHRSSNFTEWTELIPSFDGSLWYGYQQTPYSWVITTIWIDENIASQTTDINTNGDKNTYTYNIQIGALINEEQSSWDYEGNIDFSLELTY